MQFTDYNNGIYTIDHFFSVEECRSWIEKSEALGYEEAKVNWGRKQVLMKSIRNNKRLIYDSTALAIDLWEKVQAFVPKETPTGIACGLNERFRFYKYHPEQAFKPHQDGSFIRNLNEWSSYTFMIYLNEEMLGGETQFDNQIIQPITGKALIFKHELHHQGCKIIEGVKYVLRTDIMYKRKPKIF